MNRPVLQSRMRKLTGAARLSVFAAAVAAVSLAHAASSAAVTPSQPAPQVQQREAPIGHRQPRIPDLPPAVVQDENNPVRPLDAFDKKLENSICRGC